MAKSTAITKYNLGDIDSRFHPREYNLRLGLPEDATNAQIIDAKEQYVNYWTCLGLHINAARSLMYYGVFSVRILNELTPKEVCAIHGISDAYFKMLKDLWLYRKAVPETPKHSYVLSFERILEVLQEPDIVAALAAGKFSIESQPTGVTTILILTG